MLPSTSLSVSQLIRLERHRGSNCSALQIPHHKQDYPVGSCSVRDSSGWTAPQDNRSLAWECLPAPSVVLRASGSPLQQPGPRYPSGLLYTAYNLRLARFCPLKVHVDPWIGKKRRLYATQIAGPSRPILENGFKQSLSTQTRSASSRAAQLVPNNLPAGLKKPIKSVNHRDDAFWAIGHGEATRNWPKSSEERIAEAQAREEARLLKERRAQDAIEAAQRQAIVAQKTAMLEKLRLEEQKRLRLADQKIEQRRKEFGAIVSKATARLHRATVAVNNIRSESEKLLDQCEAERRELWERKAEEFERVRDEIRLKKECFRQFVTRCADSSTVLTGAIAEFCEAVSECVHGTSFSRLSLQFDALLPRHMFAERDTQARRGHLSAILWMYPDLRPFYDDIQSEAHRWRHLYQARKIHELHPEAFSYKKRWAEGYYTGHSLVSNTDAFYREYHFWESKREMLHPLWSDKSRPEDEIEVIQDLKARKASRRALAFLLKVTATDINRDLLEILDRGNFISRQQTVDFKRLQQVDLLKPFTLAEQGIVGIRNEVERLDEDYSHDRQHPRVWRMTKLKNKLVKQMSKLYETTRSSSLETLDELTYWHWLATERNVRQRWTERRKMVEVVRVEAIVPKTQICPTSKHEHGLDQAWRGTHSRTPEMRQVVVDYCVTTESAERTARLFTNSKVVGIDLWGGRRFTSVEDAVRVGNSAERCLPMLAIANEERVALLHFAAMGRFLIKRDIPTLMQILQDPSIYKVGENVKALRRRLWRYACVTMEGAVDFNSRYTQLSWSPEMENSIDSGSALARRESPTYPPEPRTTTFLSDQRLGHVGQSLNDEAIQSEDLQLTPYVRSPRLLQLSALRPYAALRLHHSMSQNTQTGGQNPAVLSASSRSSHMENVKLLPEPANAIELNSPGSHLRFTEPILGPINIDPRSLIRDRQLRVLVAALAQEIQDSTAKTAQRSHLLAYFLFTRFGQDSDDIHRILHIGKPANAILRLVETTGLPLNEKTLADLKAQEKAWAGNDSATRATKWVEETIKNEPQLRRSHRRNQRVREKFQAYAMWHHLEMEVETIARCLNRPRKAIFEFIRKTLNYPKSSFPFQKPRYLELLHEYKPKKYGEEFDRPPNEVSCSSAPGDATVDATSTSGLDSLDVGVPGNATKTPQAFRAARTVKFRRKPVIVRKILPRGVPAEAAPMQKGLKIIKVASTTIKTTPRILRRALSPAKMSRNARRKKQTSPSEQPSITQRISGNMSKACTVGPKGSWPKSAGAEKEIPSESATSNKKNKSRPGGLDWLPGMTVWTPTESLAVSPDMTDIGATGKHHKLSQSTSRRVKQVRSARASSATLSHKATRADEQREITQKPVANARERVVGRTGQDKHSLENFDGHAPTADAPIRRLVRGSHSQGFKTTVKSTGRRNWKR